MGGRGRRASRRSGARSPSPSHGLLLRMGRAAVLGARRRQAGGKRIVASGTPNERRYCRRGAVEPQPAGPSLVRAGPNGRPAGTARDARIWPGRRAIPRHRMLRSRVCKPRLGLRRTRGRGPGGRRRAGPSRATLCRRIAPPPSLADLGRSAAWDVRSGGPARRPQRGHRALAGAGIVRARSGDTARRAAQLRYLAALSSRAIARAFQA